MIETLNIYSVKIELRRFGLRNLFEMIMNEKESRCVLHGLCSFYFKYRGYGFCLSEVLSKGCELQKIEEPQEEIIQNDKEHHISLLLPIFTDKSTS